jgi:uncharacterized protein YutE (UPF0331/DUF86 family)
MKEERKNIFLDTLKEQLDRFNQSIGVLSASYAKCRSLDTKESFSDIELESIDALTSRFARASDILIQKIFGLIDAIELEERGSVLDKIHRAEKRGIIRSSADFKQIRELRNQIAHEYANMNSAELFREILHISPVLIESRSTLMDFVKRYFPDGG